MKNFLRTPLAGAIFTVILLCLIGAGARLSGLTQIVGPDPGGSTMQVNSDGSLNVDVASGAITVTGGATAAYQVTQIMLGIGPQQALYNGSNQVTYLGYSSATGNSTGSTVIQIVKFNYDGNGNLLSRTYYNSTGSLTTAWGVNGANVAGYTYTAS